MGFRRDVVLSADSLGMDWSLCRPSTVSQRIMTKLSSAIEESFMFPGYSDGIRRARMRFYPTRVIKLNRRL